MLINEDPSLIAIQSSPVCSIVPAKLREENVNKKYEKYGKE